MADLGRNHPIVRRVRSLRRNRGARDREGVFLAEGVHLALEAIANGAEIERALVSDRLEQHAEFATVRAALEKAQTPVDRVAAAVLDGLQDARSPQPVVLVVRRPSPSAPDPSRGPVVVACDVQEPGNLGAIVRTAVAAGACAVLACGRSVDPYHPRAVRATAGAVFRRPPDIVRDPHEALDRLERAGFALVAAVTDGTVRYDRLEWGRPFALVIGGEGSGLADSVRARVETTVRIPMPAGFDSLSVGAATAVVLFEAARQRGFTP